MSLRARPETLRHDATDPKLEIPGSWALRRGLMQRDAGWPFGKLSLTDHEVVLSGRGPFRYGKPIVIPLDEITQVERLKGWSFAKRRGMLRFRTRSPANDRAMFSASPSRIRRLERLLEDRGFAIEEVRGLTL